MFKRILLAVDGSKDSEKVIEWAIKAYKTLPEANFTSFYVTIPLINIVPYEVGYVSNISSNTSEEDDKYLESPAFQALQKFSDQERINYKIVEGSVAKEICEEAERGHYDLIVLGSKGHGMVSSVLLGSVSAKVLHHAPCPVLIVR